MNESFDYKGEVISFLRRRFPGRPFESILSYTCECKEINSFKCTLVVTIPSGRQSFDSRVYTNKKSAERDVSYQALQWLQITQSNSLAPSSLITASKSIQIALDSPASQDLEPQSTSQIVGNEVAESFPVHITTGSPSSAKLSKSHLQEFFQKRGISSGCLIYATMDSPAAMFIVKLTITHSVFSGEFISGSHPQKRLAENDAASQALVHLETVNGVAVICRTCHSDLAPIADFMFYRQSDTDVLFGLKTNCLGKHADSMRSSVVGVGSDLGLDGGIVVCSKCNHQLGSLTNVQITDGLNHPSQAFSLHFISPESIGFQTFNGSTKPPIVSVSNWKQAMESCAVKADVMLSDDIVAVYTEMTPEDTIESTTVDIDRNPSSRDGNLSIESISGKPILDSPMAQSDYSISQVPTLGAGVQKETSGFQSRGKPFKSQLYEYLQQRGVSLDCLKWESKPSSSPMMCTMQLTITHSVFSGEFTSGSHPQKRLAENDAASQALVHLETVRCDKKDENVNVICRSCKKYLAPIKDCMFFQQLETEISFGLKPECEDKYVETLRIVREVDNTNPILGGTIECMKCPGKGNKLGLLTRVQSTNSLNPRTFSLQFFSTNSIGFQSLSTTKEPSIVIVKNWKQAMESFAVTADIRTSDDIFDARVVTIKESEAHQNSNHSSQIPTSKKLKVQRRSRENRIDLQFDPSKTIFENLSISDIMSKSNVEIVPRMDQISVIGSAMLRNLIVVMPTGAGKTLPACIAMAIYIKLNPNKIAVMIVDRIPLVDQQANVFERVTGDYALRLIGETGTYKQKIKLTSLGYNAVISTSGAMEKLLKNKLFDFDISDFSVLVFDECHHINGKHSYCNLLSMVQDCEEKKRPRLIGLSASPCKAESISQALESLKKVRGLFLDADILMPLKGSISVNNIDWKVVDVSKNKKQTLLERKLFDQLSQLIEGCRSNLKYLDADERRMFQSSTARTKEGRALLTGFASRHRRDDLMKIIFSIEVNEIFGPGFISQNRFKNEGGMVLYRYEVNLCESSLDRSDDLSQYLLTLEEVIRESLNSSEEKGRIIVFVETKNIAELLRRRLDHSFKEANCQKIVGHSLSNTGMSIAQQRRVIELFNTGQSSIIISTSVVEEGLDIQDCNLVIRFGGHGSLIQLLQSRGRARSISPNSKMVVILTLDMKGKAQETANQEQYMTAAVDALDTSASFTSFFSQIGGEPGVEGDDSRWLKLKEDIETRRKLAGCGFGNGPNNESIQEFKLIICNDQLKNASTSIGKLAFETLSNDIGLFGEVFNFSIIPKSLLPSIGLSQLLDADGQQQFEFFSVNLKTSFADCLSRVAKFWDFQVSLGRKHFQNCYVSVDKEFMQRELLIAEIKNDLTQSQAISQSDLVTLDGILSIQVGYLAAGKEFYSHRSLGRNCLYSSLEIEHHPDRVLRINSAMLVDQYVSIEIDLSTLGKCLFLTMNPSLQQVELYFHLTSVPALNIKHATKNRTQRVSIAAESSGTVHGDYRDQMDEGADADESLDQSIVEEDLKALAFAPILQVNFPITSWDAIVKIVSDSTNLGIPCLLTRISPPLNFVSWSDPAIKDFYTDEVYKKQLENDDQLWELHWSYHSILLETRAIGIYPSLLFDLSKDFDDVVSTYRGLTTPNIRLEVAQKLANLITAYRQLAVDMKSQSPWIDLRRRYGSYLRSAIPETPLKIPDGHFLCYRLVITPSSIRLLPTIPVVTNRLIRLFGSIHRLIYVHFRNENYQLIYNKAVYDNRYQDMLTHGISFGEWFKSRFLVCSNSQMREQSGVFLFGHDQSRIEAIRNQLIPKYRTIFKDNFAKQMSRLGLFCTAEVDMGNLHLSQVVNCRDDKAQDGTILTDGAGVISRDLLELILEPHREQMLERLPNILTASAIQIRYNGSKGVLTIVDSWDSVENHPLLTSALKQKDCSSLAILRESMTKFESDHIQLCIVKTSDYNPLTLNRDMLNLLFSFSLEGVIGGDWNPAIDVNDLQEAELMQLVQPLIDNDAAIKSLHGIIDPKLLPPFGLLDEPFFVSLLSTIYLNNAKYLLRKTHIPIKDGALLMGVPDISNTLADDEVFVRIQRQGNAGLEDFILQDRWILVYRNPCLDPSDLRILRAVDKQALHCFKNVIIFPSIDGVTKTSISGLCSGGDLDGDLFGVIWNDKLIFDKRRELRGLDYAAILEEAKKNQTKAAAPEDEAQFLVSCMCNPLLGRVAKLHLAICDQLPNSAMNETARKLAKCQSLAVDYPKTGVAPIIPLEVTRAVREKGYPDFMEMINKTSYPSTKPLGKLYQRCSSIVCDIAIQQSLRFREVNNLLLKPGYERYSAKARETLQRYKHIIKQLMIRYSIQTEAEIIVGISSLQTLSSNQELTIMRQDSLELGMKRDRAFLDLQFRQEFINSFVHDEGNYDIEHEYQCLASAWYHATYSEEIGQSSYLGLPWIVGDFLIQVYHSNCAPFQPLYKKELPISLLSSAKEMLESWRKTSTVLRANQMERLEIINALEMRLSEESKMLKKTYQIQLSVYGSVSHFLCDETSDFDLFVKCETSSRVSTESKKSEDILSTILWDLLELLSLKKEMKGSVIKSIFDRSELIQSSKNTDSNLDQKISVDFSVNNNGLEKAEYIRRLYVKYPSFLPLLSNLMEWGKVSGIIRSSTNTSEDLNQLRPGEFHALILHLLSFSDTLESLRKEQSLRDDLVDIAGNYFNEKVISFLTRDISSVTNTQVTPEDIATRLLLFFQKGCQLAEELEYTWPTPEKPVHQFDKAIIVYFATLSFRSLHFLTSFWSWSTFLEQIAIQNSSIIQFVYRVAISLSAKIRGYPLHYEMKLRNASGASMVKFEFSEKNSYCQLIAEGTHLQIRRLKQELNQLIHFNKQFSTTSRWLNSRNQQYFLHESTALFVRNNGGNTGAINDNEENNSVSDVSLSCAPYGTNDLCSPFHCDCEMATLTKKVSSNSADIEVSGVQESRDDSEEAPANLSWIDYFCDKLHDKVLQQIAKVVVDPNEVDEKVIDSISLNVHFGVFYLIDAYTSLKGAASNISLQYLEDLLTSNFRNMKVFESDRDFDASSLPSPYDEPIKSEEKERKEEDRKEKNGQKNGGPSSGSASSTSAAESSIHRMKCGFWNGITNKLAREDQLDSRSNLMKSLKSILVDKLGYSFIFSKDYHKGLSDVDCTESKEFIQTFTKRCHSNSWNIETVPSRSWCVHTFLDRDLQISHVRERKLIVVNATLIDSTRDVEKPSEDASANCVEKEGTKNTESNQKKGNEKKVTAETSTSPASLLGKHDVRIRLDYSPPALTCDSPLRKKCLPQDLPPVEIDEFGCPKPSSHLSEANRDCVQFARHVKNRYVYSKVFSVNLAGQTIRYAIVADIAVGYQYFGRNLELKKSFLELGVEIETVALKMLCRQQITESTFREWIFDMIKHVLAISEEVSKSSSQT